MSQEKPTRGLGIPARISTRTITTLFMGLMLGAFASGWMTAPKGLQAESSGIPEGPGGWNSRERLAAVENTGRVFQAVSELVSPAVVYIESRQRNADGKIDHDESGSGVLVRLPGHDWPFLVTNHHVIGSASSDDVSLFLADGRMIRPRKIWSDPQTDLAVIDVGRQHLPAAPLGDSERVAVGQWVLAIGSPFGLSQSVTHGIVSAKHRRQLNLPDSLRIKEFLQTDAAINPGNSGGPLVNLRGEVIGINTAIATKNGSSSGVAFSIPINLAKYVIQQLVKHGRVRRALLGVGFAESFTHTHARSLGLTVPRGALIDRVYPSTPAQNADLQSGDVILSFDGQWVDDENHLINLVAQTEVGRDVKILVWRNRQRVPLRASLVEWNDRLD